MEIEFLDADQAGGLAVPDVYYSSEYGRSAELIDSGTWECAVAEGGRYAFPYIRRQVQGLDSEYDLVSPYGYAGIVAPSDSQRSDFVHEFRKVSRDRGLISEFLRTNPYDVVDPGEEGFVVGDWRTHPTYSVDLQAAGVQEYWESAEGRFRTAVRKAERVGVTVAHTDPLDMCDEFGAFRGLYDATMERVGSSSRLKLPTEYYEKLVSGLGDNVVLLVAILDGKPIAAAVFLRWCDRLHYHLSGSSPEGMKAGATNILLDAAVRSLLPENGRLHLGGGLAAGDGLERFKRSMANQPTYVHLCRTVVNHGRYNELVHLNGADPASDYFPAYRG